MCTTSQFLVSSVLKKKLTIIIISNFAPFLQYATVIDVCNYKYPDKY